MTRAQTALWFVKSFGQEVKSIAMKEVKSGSKRKAKIGPGLDSLSKQEKEKVDPILFLLDIFCIGDSSYHELSMFNDLPKSYLIKQRQTQPRV